MTNESAMIGGSGMHKSLPNILEIARMQHLTDEPLARQGLAEVYVREQVLGLLAERIMTAVRRREKPPVDPSILKIAIAQNKAVFGDIAASFAGANAMLEESEVDRWLFNEVMGRYTVSIGGGTTEVQKNNLAERQLGLPKEPSNDRELAWSQLLKS
jgi:acyl-CoA dehydrogenase